MNDAPTVEWHTFGQHKVSFDVRGDASRFIIVLDSPRELLAKGLISTDLGGRPRIDWDDGIPGNMVLRAAWFMLERYEVMRAKLLSGEIKSGWDRP